MVRREIELDEETDRILTNLAADYEGDLGRAVANLVLAREGMEEFADRSEAAQQGTLCGMRERAEADFRDGRTVNWEDLKARNRL